MPLPSLQGELKFLKVEEEVPEQNFGAYKAERLLMFSAKAFAVAKWAHKECLTDWYDSMLEVFWAPPSKGNRSPNVEELKRCERACWEKAFRITRSTGCTLESALAKVQESGMFENLLQERPVIQQQSNNGVSIASFNPNLRADLLIGDRILAVSIF